MTRLQQAHRSLFQWWTNALCYADLTTDNRPSFSKLVLLAILVTCIIRNCLSLGIVIALLSASFGKSTFVAFLKRSQIAASEQDIHVTAQSRQEIIARRDPTLGIDPA